MNLVVAIVVLVVGMVVMMGELVLLTLPQVMIVLLLLLFPLPRPQLLDVKCIPRLGNAEARLKIKTTVNKKHINYE